VLDIADIARDGGPVLDTLILTVVVEANLDAVNRDPALQRIYGALDSPPPDELRRPVAVNSVAASLGLPYETVRRHLVRMASLGQCEFAPGGVLVPAARLMAPRFVQICVARYERTQRLYQNLKAIGALPSLAVEPKRSYANPALALGDAPVRLVNRLLSEYYLRLIEMMMRRLGDPVTALVLLGLARANMAALSDEARAADTLQPEAARQPVRRSALAAQLGLPAETVRRRLTELEQRGYCGVTRGGIMISMDFATRADSLRLLQENQGNLIRFLSRLRRYGLLDLWDAASDDAAGA
jgi:hypothetical protein